MGVTLQVERSGNRRWRARAYRNGKVINLGSFGTSKEAHLAYDLYLRNLVNHSAPETVVQGIGRYISRASIDLAHLPKPGILARIFGRFKK